jgi:DNA-binding transcriptional regulator YhcF (GntR family)
VPIGPETLLPTRTALQSFRLVCLIALCGEEIPTLSTRIKPMSSTEQKPANTKREMRDSIRKWGKPVIDAGFLIVPSMLFHHQRTLKLSPLDLNILLQLADHWWKANQRPYPSKARLAKRLGVHPRTIQRHIAALEGRDLIKRVKRWDRANGQRSNEYDLKGLANALHPFAIQAKRKKKAKKQTKNGNNAENEQ